MLSKMWLSVRNRGHIKSDDCSPPAGLPQVVFDWDDTLCPTSFLRKAVPSLRKPIEHDSKFYKPLLQHAKHVEKLLRSTAQIAGVSVVTLASRAWFEKSCEWFFPGYDLRQLLWELDIPVFFADAKSKMACATSMKEVGVRECLMAKTIAFGSLLPTLYSGREVQWNVLSVGDSKIEAEALKDVITMRNATNGNHSQARALCKTLKLKDNPSLCELTREVTTLFPAVEKMIRAKTNLHGIFDESCRLQTKL